jgi:hypothetical protein
MDSAVDISEYRGVLKSGSIFDIVLLKDNPKIDCVSLSLHDSERKKSNQKHQNKNIVVKGKFISYNEYMDRKYEKFWYWAKYEDIDYLNLSSCGYIGIEYQIEDLK